MSTREIIDSYFACVNSHRWDDYLDLFADNVVMEEQLAGHIEGKTAVAKGIEGLRTSKFFQNHPVQIVVDGDKAVALFHLQTVGPHGEPIEAKGANYYEIANGKI